MSATKKHCKSEKEWKNAGLVVFFMLCILFLTTGTTWAWDANNKLCFPDVINTPDTYMQPPVIDGKIDGDNGWTSAWRYAFNNGTYVHDVVVQGIKDASYIYLSFEVNNDLAYNANDAVVIAFDPTGFPSDRKLLEVFPVNSGGAVSPVTISYWNGDPLTGAAPPAGIVSAASSTISGSSVSWTLELKIPRGAFNIPSTGDFGLYFDIISVYSPTTGPSNGTASEYPWPADSPYLANLFVTNLDAPAIPDPSYWGTSTVGSGTTCNGVSINPWDIKTDNLEPYYINLYSPNTFRATVHNSSTNGGGNPIPAKAINATFKIADFGLGGGSYWDAQWNKVPTATNPTGTTDIGANSTADLTMSWQLDAAQAASYAARTHQCILVELDSNATSTPWATTFTNRSAWTNMEFLNASVVEDSPQIDPTGWPKIGKHMQLDLFITQKIDELNRNDVVRAMRMSADKRNPGRGRAMRGSWADLSKLEYFPAKQNASSRDYKNKLNNPQAKVSQLAYMVHGCVRTGQQVTIKNNKYDICKSVGSFGYVLRHAGPAKARWKSSLFTGPSGTQTMEAGKHYQISLDKKLKLKARFEATDQLGPIKPVLRGR